MRLTGVGILSSELYARVPLDPDEDYVEEGVKLRRVSLLPGRPRWGYAAHDTCCMILRGRLGHIREEIILRVLFNLFQCLPRNALVSGGGEGFTARRIDDSFWDRLSQWDVGS